MSEYQFNAQQRFVVYTVHGEKCYLCQEALDYCQMEIDHVIPESKKNTNELNKILKAFRLPQDFEINGFGNWLPACRQCNRKKSNNLFRVTPLIQMQIDELQKKKGVAEKLFKKTISERKISRAINDVQRAIEDASLNKKHIVSIQILISLLFNDPEFKLFMDNFYLTETCQVTFDTKKSPQEFNISFREGNNIFTNGPYQILSDDGIMLIAKGPYGIGSGPSNASSAMRCSICGNAAFNGARCIWCGEMSDD